ncbi:kinase-like protein [Schizopora paradoxa]|uniref:Kinase-like protein n=1 Tax=Schizopora paradoxa TaxID=27342 RepID=A0A0H2SDH4_9AGAM|nr:kinase-like protein [Schizopora paradoxa]
MNTGQTSQAPEAIVPGWPAATPCPLDIVDSTLIIRRVLGRNPLLNLTGFVKVDPLNPKAECGGFGDVYRGLYTHPLTGDAVEVAVKRCRCNGDSPRYKTQKGIAREMRIWSELDHPNITPFLGYIVEGSRPSFVSEWMKDGSLRSYLRRLNRVESVSIVRGYILQVVLLIDSPHRYWILHADWRTCIDNILVTWDKHAVLTDFGISCMDTISSGYSTSSFSGSTRWQAVELFSLTGDPQFTTQTDVWAFGMTVYEILTKRMPYAKVVLVGRVIRFITEGVLPEKPAFSKNPVDGMIEEFMWSLCEDCWKTDPIERPTMRDLEDRIRFFKELELRV